MKRTPSTDNQAAIAARFAMSGKDDPTIARVLECSVSHVRSLRREYGIDPGETRWLSHKSPLNTRYVTPASTSSEEDRPDVGQTVSAPESDSEPVRASGHQDDATNPPATP